jgi:hypothetical protein
VWSLSSNDDDIIPSYSITLSIPLDPIILFIFQLMHHLRIISKTIEPCMDSKSKNGVQITILPRAN